MVPETVREALDHKVSPGVSWDEVSIHVGRLPTGLAQAPHAMAPRNIIPVAGAFARQPLKTVGMTIGRDIYLAPTHADFNTAAGLALVAHEMVHVAQGERVPAFEEVYEAAAMGTPPDKPWLNPYERPAYVEEARVYRHLLAEGYPPGDWVPLGVQVGLA